MKIVVVLISILLISFIEIKKRNEPTLYEFPFLLYFPKMPLPEHPVTKEGVELGRHLFYDKSLSDNYTFSCASCHKQNFAFADSVSLTPGRKNIPLKRNTMPLFNLAWYPAYFWDGRACGIEDQIFHPLRQENEMNLDWEIAAERIVKSEKYRKMFYEAYGRVEIDSNLISNAIGQFLRTLISYESKYDKVLAGKEYFTKEEYEGFVLVNDQTKGDCIHCHITDGDVLGTNLIFSNNGLDEVKDGVGFKDNGRGEVTGNQNDKGKFKVPSLRNLAFTAPYMHDGRFKTLEEVIDFYSEGVKISKTIDSKMEYAHQGGVKLTADEKRKIIRFLYTLSDSSFIFKKEFANPL